VAGITPTEELIHFAPPVPNRETSHKPLAEPVRFCTLAVSVLFPIDVTKTLWTPKGII
jgi:hypothetical protein